MTTYYSPKKIRRNPVHLITSLTSLLVFAFVGFLPTVGYSANRTVALSGTVAPGTDANTIFDGFGIPVMNGNDRVAFSANLTRDDGQPNNNSQGIWSDRSGNLALLARVGDAAPGVSGDATFLSLFSPLINASGQIAFEGMLTGTEITSANNQGIWSDGTGSLGLVARTGDAAPGTDSGVNFNWLNPPHKPFAFSADGKTSFMGYVSGPDVNFTNDWGIWSGVSGNVELIARVGSEAPGTGPGVTYSWVDPPVINGNGQTAFVGFLTGNDVTLLNNSGIWSNRSGSVALEYRGGQPAPGVGSNIDFVAFGSPVINDNGQMAFKAELNGSGLTNDNSGIWSEDSLGNLTLVARSGHAAPGTDGIFSGFWHNYTDPVINANGHTAFVTFIEGTGVTPETNMGIWSEGFGSLALVVRTGDEAPGTEPGVVFDFIDGHVGGINANGQVVFTARLRGPGITDANNRGIWAQDSSGTLQLIVRQGDLMDVDDSPDFDIRTVAGFDYHSISIGSGTIGSGNQDGRASAFSDLGHFAFRAFFTDGSSGIFVSDLVAVPVPESSSLVLGILATLGLLPPILNRRRRLTS